ncbi:efflux RND transporter permease subunit [Parvularcula sp. ZS-1/3]|uniref:Efflux RND transporter permease subunit n=1 Tax=Parvularcula mediterranea TaxID=2732508 RepID=A0A7Y3W5Q7_9PROT|nr:efflux RND transporter permease subunit [Parvularcula mediterranea]NNU16748.1 efflux RND transporter permease subunit [Parvularcula mediterranea]
MNGLVSWWAKNEVAANLLMAFIIIIGMLSFFSLSREAQPSIQPQSVSINISWPGASPTDVEEQIVLRIEEEMANLDNVKELTAIAREGSASLTVEMTESGDFDSFLNEVKARVDGVSNLPQDSFPPVVARTNFGNNLAWIMLSGDVGERKLNRLAREVRNELAAVPGATPLINVQGLRTEEVSIEVSEESLRRYGLTFDDVSRAIRGSSLNLSMGEIRTDTGNIPLASRNLANTEREFGEIIVRQDLDGSVIRVRDVAKVIDGFPDANFRFRIDGEPGMIIELNQPENANLKTIMAAVRGYIERKNAELPNGAKLELLFTLEEFYDGRMRIVSENAATGLLLVLIILMLFLRPTVAFWVAIGIGVAFIGTFIFMPMVGVSLNMLSLFGLLLVIGIVVDDALVVGESINRQVEIGREGVDAAIVGTQIVLKPVVFAVLTTMLAFSPFLFIGGMFKAFLQAISWTIILALTFSLIESFLILPAHLAHLKKPSGKGIMAMQGKLADGLLWFADRFYRPMIKTAIHGRTITIAFFLGLFAVSVSLVGQGWIPLKFDPDIENDFLQTNIAMQEGTSWTRTQQVYDQIEAANIELDKVLLDKAGKDIMTSTQLWGWTGGLNGFNTFVSGDERGMTMAEIGDIYRDLIGPIPDAQEITISSTFSNGSNRFVLAIETNDLDQAAAAADEIKEYLRSRPILYDVRDNLQAPLDELRLKLRPGAERFGVTVQDVARQLRQAYYGEEVQRLPRDGQDVRVMVRYPLEQRESLESLYSGFRIRTPDGREIPVSSVVEFETGPAVRFIRRTDRKRSVTIFARIREGADAGPLRGEFYGQVVPQILAKYPAVDIVRRGGDQEQAEFLNSFFVGMMAALLGMYMLLAIAFGSYFQPLLIMSAIPFGYMGAVFGHAIFGIEFSIFSFFGIAAAAGVVVNDNLVLVDYVNRLRAQGAGAFAALVEAGTVRFRPILLTSVTTFIGLLPILLERSIDAEFLKPVVVSLSFGVAFALFVTLFFVPAMYAAGADIQRFFKGIWTGERQPRLGEGASAEGVPEIKGAEHVPAE